MSLSKKLQSVFNWLLLQIKAPGSDILKISPDLDKKLKEEIGAGINSAQFVKKVFEALEYPSSVWKPDKNDLLTFFESLPESIVASNWDVIHQYVDRSRWDKLNPQRGKIKSNFIDTLSNEPIILIEEDKKRNLIFNVFLGDISDKLGITQKDLDDNYDEVYDSIEQEIGKTAISKYIPSNIKVTDWPNASIITNAKYEFLVKSEKDPPIESIKNHIILALNKIGF